jgi:arylsulfatase
VVTELHDLAASQPARVISMRAMWDAWVKRIGVQPWPMPQTPPGERSGKLTVPSYLERCRLPN